MKRIHLKPQDPCWCGSGRPYGECHQAFDQKIAYYKKRGHIVPPHSLIRTPAEIAGIQASAEINTAVLDAVAAALHEGMSTEEIDKIVDETTTARGAICAPLNYEGYPKSVCTSVNNEVCHGIPSHRRKLKSGDIVNVDVSTIYNGFYSDASRMFMIGQVSDENRRLVEETKECLNRGIAAAQAWHFVGDIGAAVQSYAESCGYSVVRELGGHGVGIKFHDDPFVSHVGKKNTGMLLVPGMVMTVEPMINMGGARVEMDRYNGWTIYTQDGKPSAQWEHTILITEEGPQILTY